MFNTQQILAATKAQAINMIKANLVANDKWLIRGILAIHARQTADEQSSHATKHHNSIGFNGLDGGILSSFADQIKAWVPSERRPQPLSPRQLEIARKKMPKYAGQLLSIILEKQAEAVAA